MQPLLLILLAAAYLGLRSHRTDEMIEAKYILGASLLLAAMLYFPRFL